jgi:hypothetical protein
MSLERCMITAPHNHAINAPVCWLPSSSSLPRLSVPAVIAGFATTIVGLRPTVLVTRLCLAAPAAAADHDPGLSREAKPVQPDVTLHPASRDADGPIHRAFVHGRSTERKSE